MVNYLGARHRIPRTRRAIALMATLLLPALSVAIPVMDRDLAITDPVLAAPDSHSRYFHDHQSICVPMEASQPLVSGAVGATLPELPVMAPATPVPTRVSHASPTDRPRSRSPPPA